MDMMKPMKRDKLRTNCIHVHIHIHLYYVQACGLWLLHQYWIPFWKYIIKKTYKIEFELPVIDHAQHVSRICDSIFICCCWCCFSSNTLFDKKNIFRQFISRVYDLQSSQLYYRQHKHISSFGCYFQLNDNHNEDKN